MYLDGLKKPQNLSADTYFPNQDLSLAPPEYN
jgi:hypothetical protein